MRPYSFGGGGRAAASPVPLQRGRWERESHECHTRTVNKLELQRVVVAALNELLGDREGYQRQLQQNIAAVIRASATASADAIDEKLLELQQELLKKANSKEAYDEIADEIFRLKGTRRTLLAGGAVTGALSGPAGSGGPIGAAVFLSLNLAPVAYIASEAATATAMHLLKTVLYAKLAHVTPQAFGTGVLMGLAMVAGTFLAKRLIRNMERGRFQKFVMVLLCLAGGYLLLFGA
ncbi:MAG: TSUP family transporter [Candidatus Avoscillospira sp.]